MEDWTIVDFNRAQQAVSDRSFKQFARRFEAGPLLCPSPTCRVGL